jgi:hypothetical protein
MAGTAKKQHLQVPIVDLHILGEGLTAASGHIHAQLPRKTHSTSVSANSLFSKKPT